MIEKDRNRQGSCLGRIRGYTINHSERMVAARDPDEELESLREFYRMVSGDIFDDAKETSASRAIRQLDYAITAEEFGACGLALNLAVKAVDLIIEQWPAIDAIRANAKRGNE